jgi:uncharacterized membrane protein
MNTLDFCLIVFAAMMHSGWNFFTKKSEANKIAILWFGWLVAGIIMLPITLIQTDLSQFQTSWIPYMILTAIFHAGYLYSLGRSYSIGEMSLIYPISRGIGIFITICVMLMFGIEELSAQGLLGVIFLILGIISVALKRFRDLEKRAAMKLAVRVGIFVSLYSITDKLSLAVIPPLFYITTMFLSTALIMWPVIKYRIKGDMYSVIMHHKTYSASIGLVSFFTYFLILLAMRDSLASYVVALREVSIVFGSVLGMWLLREESNKRKILGIISIVIGAYIIKTT